MLKKFTLQVDKPFITLSQLLKTMGIVQSGGEVRHFLAEEHVHVNDETELRRGRKLYPGDIVVIAEETIQIVGA